MTRRPEGTFHFEFTRSEGVRDRQAAEAFFARNPEFVAAAEVKPA
jgi:hypothetical protein